MDTVTLSIIFKDEAGSKVYVKLNDIRNDITSAEVLTLVNKIIDDDILDVRGKSVVEFVSAEKIIREAISI